jgi:hypothetical protein
MLTYLSVTYGTRSRFNPQFYVEVMNGTAERERERERE